MGALEIRSTATMRSAAVERRMAAAWQPVTEWPEPPRRTALARQGESEHAPKAAMAFRPRRDRPAPPGPA